MANWGITPGPLNNELLFLADEHRAAYYFQNPQNEAGALRPRRGDMNFWQLIKQKPIPDNVMYHIRRAGFGGIIDCGYRKLDGGLITALVERWRPETHTFHLPVGECTITLQDVQVLWGLHVDGEAITGTDVVMNKAQIIDWFGRLTGCLLDPHSIDGLKINLPCIYKEMEIDLPSNASFQECQQRARLIILYLIGATLFPQSSSNWLHANFLTHVEDLDECGQLSWGSATLAWLYRQLCKATKITATEIGGPLFLLQLWAWERLPTLSPINNRTLDPSRPYPLPYGARWQGGTLRYTSTTQSCLSAYRSSLHSLNNAMFIWRPYEEIIHCLPENCRNGHLCWSSDTFLIFWEYVEPHCASRVMRQFGMVQTIPTWIPLTQQEHVRLHNLSRKGGRNSDWKQKHAVYNQRWENRHATVVIGAYTNSTVASEEYMRWYMDRTVRFITNPAHQAPNPHGFQNDGQITALMMEGMSQFSQMADNQPVSDMANRYLDYAHVDHRGYLPAHVMQNPVQVQLAPVPQRVRRRGRGRGRGPVREENVEQQNIGHQNFQVDQDFGSPQFSPQFQHNFLYEGTSSSQYQMGTQNYGDAGPSSNFEGGTNFLNLFGSTAPLPYYPQFQETGDVVARFSNNPSNRFDLNDEATELDEDFDAPRPTQRSQGR